MKEKITVKKALKINNSFTKYSSNNVEKYSFIALLFVLNQTLNSFDRKTCVIWDWKWPKLGCKVFGYNSILNMKNKNLFSIHIELKKVLIYGLFKFN